MTAAAWATLVPTIGATAGLADWATYRLATWAGRG